MKMPDAWLIIPHIEKDLRNGKEYLSLETCEQIMCKNCKWFKASYGPFGVCNGFASGATVPDDGMCHNAEEIE